MQLVTASRLRDFRACARLHRYRYLDLVRPAADSPAARFGTLVHVGLEAWWSAADGRLAASIAAMRARADVDTDPYDLARAEALLTGYDVRWLAEADALETLAVEHEFRAPLVNPTTGAASRTYEIGGKIDALVRDADGRVWLVEHKTSTLDISPGSEYWARLRMDQQIAVYIDGAKHAGHDVAGCLYDVLARPLHRPSTATPEADRKYTAKASTLKDGTVRPAGSLHANQREADETVDEFRARIMAAIAESPDRYYQRGTVVRLDSELDEHRWDTWHTARLMREAELANRHVRNPDACVRYGSTCPYFPVCSGEASIDDPVRFTKTVAHPELFGAAAISKEEMTDGIQSDSF